MPGLAVLSDQKIQALQDACKVRNHGVYSAPRLLALIAQFVAERLPLLSRTEYAGDRAAPTQSSLDRFMGTRKGGGIAQRNARSLELLLDLFLEQHHSDLTGEFTSAVKILVEKNAGHLCSSCRRPTSYPNGQQPLEPVDVGVVLPISLDRPNYSHDERAVSENRKLADVANGIWLCGNCSTRIINARRNKRFPPEELRAMKETHEAFAGKAGRSGKDIVLEFVPEFASRNQDVGLMNEVVAHVSAQKWILGSFRYLPAELLPDISSILSFLRKSAKPLDKKSNARIIIITLAQIISLFKKYYSSGPDTTQCRYAFLAMQHMIGFYLAITRKVFRIEIPAKASKLIPGSNGGPMRRADSVR